MRKFVDLHTHSNASDGSLSPGDLVRAADAANLAAVALTDHDTLAGLAEARSAAADLAELQFLPGIEISAQFTGGTMHILGLGVDDRSPSLAQTIEFLQAARRDRNPKIVERLQALGLAITMDDVLAVAAERRDGKPGEIISRVHIAEALRRKAVVASVDEAFAKYLAAGSPAYVPKERLAPSKAIEMIRSASGLAVLAHPTQLQLANRAQIERVVRELIHAGLEGIEVYHPDHDEAHTRQYLELARKFKLAITGGSDWHGPLRPPKQLGHPRVPATFFEELLARLARRG